MTNRVPAGMVLFLAALELGGCGGSPTAPGPPTESTSTPAPVLPAPPAPVTTTPAPTGNQPINGTVYDSAFRPLAGATVEFLNGPQAGTSTTTDARGAFALFGIVDDTTRFRASKDGHVAGTATILPDCPRCNPRRWVFFYLDVLEPPVALAGHYSLTFIADSSCTTLPTDLLTRTYAVSVENGDVKYPSFPPSATSFKVTPIGGDFPEGLNHFYLNVAGNYINVTLGDHTDTGVAERIAPDRYFGFNGSATVSVVAPVSTISTPFQGWIDYCVNPAMGARYDCTPGPTVTLARCESNRHQLILSRQ